MLKTVQGETSSLERELKFSLGPGGATRLRRHPLLQGITPTVQDLSTVYYDTPERVLDRAGLTLRLRRSASGTVQTVKHGSGAPGGLFARMEAEKPISGNDPDIDHLLNECPAIDREVLDGRIEPLFRVEVVRSEWRLEYRGSVFHIDLDEGRIATDQRAASIQELEIELREGAVEPIFELAREIAAGVPWRLETASKSERGFRLLDDHESGPVQSGLVKAPAILPSRSMTAAAGFQAAATQSLQHFAANAARFSVLSDAECVHQMRVALRRLRSLIAFHAPLFDAEERAMLRREIGWIFRRLGSARDYDVLLSLLSDIGDDPALAGRMAEIRQGREAAYEGIARALGSKRFRVAQIGLLEFAECGAWTRSDRQRRTRRRDKPLKEVASRALAREWRKLIASGTASRLDTARRHRLRIRAKKFRYACDFFGALYDQDKAVRRRGRILAAVAGLQDELGALNDRAAMRQLVQQKFPGAEALAAPLGCEGDDIEREHLAAADRTQKKLLQRRPFWT